MPSTDQRRRWLRSQQFYRKARQGMTGKFENKREKFENKAKVRVENLGFMVWGLRFQNRGCIFAKRGIRFLTKIWKKIGIAKDVEKLQKYTRDMDGYQKFLLSKSRV